MKARFALLILLEHVVLLAMKFLGLSKDHFFVSDQMDGLWFCFVFYNFYDPSNIFLNSDWTISLNSKTMNLLKKIIHWGQGRIKEIQTFPPQIIIWSYSVRLLFKKFTISMHYIIVWSLFLNVFNPNIKDNLTNFE